MKLWGLLALALSLQFAGCRPQDDPLVTKAKHQFLVTDCPTNPMSIATLANNPELAGMVTIAGRIYGGDMSPFDPHFATFTIIDLPEPGHSHEDPGDCPFCKHKADNAAMAVIQLLDDRQQPIGMPADKLLGLRPNQDVVVTGSPYRVDDLLLVKATTVHMLDEPTALELAKKFDEANKPVP